MERTHVAIRALIDRIDREELKLPEIQRGYVWKPQQVAALIESRSCERLGLLAAGLPEGELQAFYAELAQSEDGHQRLFVRLAEGAHGEAARLRLDALLDAEAALLRRLPVRAAIH